MNRFQVGDWVSFRAIIENHFSGSGEPYRIRYNKDNYTDLTVIQVYPSEGTIPVNEEEYQDGEVVQLIPHQIVKMETISTLLYGKPISYHQTTLVAKIEGWGDQKLYVRDIDNSIFYLCYITPVID